MRATTRTLAGAALLLLAACAGRDAVGTAGTTAPAGGGWIGEAPDFRASRGGEGDTAAAEPALEATLGAAMETAAPGDVAPGDVAGEPRAGSVDDNADYERFLDYLVRIDGLGLGVRRVDLAGRVVVRVTDPAGRGAPGTEVGVRAGGTEVARLRTTADGTVRFFPGAWAAPEGPYTFVAGDAAVEVAAGTSAELVLAAPVATTAVPVDLLFVLDATGSMADELDRLTATIGDIAGRIGGLAGVADVRLGMTVYRDEGDAFVTATHDFTADVATFGAALDTVVADGGGDTPEALDEALAEALAAPSWRPAGEALALMVLVADATAHHERQVTPWTATARDAASRGMKILPIASSSSDDAAEATFRQIAALTGGRFVFLSYGAAGAATGGATDIGTTDYEELPLDDLVVRLVAEEVSAWSGTPVTLPPPDPTTGQQ